ncbi:MAG: SUMF1/EgtB/PvdO family nonheme iron enzyme, partial [Planctomycetota bacterium]
RLPPGHYRFTASIPGIGHAELLRTFEAGPRTHALQARIHDASARAIPLVDIPTGNLRLVPQKQVGCLWLRQRTLDVPAFRLGRTEVSNGEFVDYLAAASRAGWPAAEPPANWVALGFDPILGLAESAETLESWRNLPVVGMSLDDARGYAEWHGLRLPMHTELEYAMAGADEGVGEWTPGDDVDGQPLANVLGATASFATSDREAGYRLYLENAASVFDERFEQEPFGLLHAHGNVSELSESPLTEPVANRVSLMSEDHVVIGSYYGSAADGLALHTHGRSGVESYYYRVQTGFRLAASDFTESKR